MGTDQVEALFARTENSLIISELAAVELYSTSARKVRTGEITREAYKEILKNFEDDCRQRFIVLLMSGAMTETAKDLLQRYGTTKALRTLDALHLGACVGVSITGPLAFVCADTRLAEVAALEGIEVLDPEVP